MSICIEEGKLELWEINKVLKLNIKGHYCKKILSLRKKLHEDSKTGGLIITSLSDHNCPQNYISWLCYIKPHNLWEQTVCSSRIPASHTN